ncbi:AAA family ATPase [Microscilla marina]|uniref:AAA family ATPase n=1 Tax=Microscilla marina TaxID=1027 RepID=UPI0005D47B97|nr:AAA family ATPase [Microscilla marina]
MNLITSQLNLLFEGRKVLVYELPQGEFPSPTLVKVLKNPHPTPEELSQFYNEYRVAQTLNEHEVMLNDTEGVRKVYKKGSIDQKPALFLEHIIGTTLAEIIREKEQFNIIDFLNTAIELTHIVGRIHHFHVIHRDITPNNIILDKTKKPVIIDFGLATELSGQTFFIGNQTLEGTIAYISPEQTGRMNRRVDHRSDLYSLGIVFYEMLTGTLPFNSNDKIELVHAHLAMPPIPPEEVVPSIPPIISQIILKLLSKNVEHRYQSAYGLRADLTEIAYYLKSQPNASVSFNIAQKDRSGILQIPEKLYGRKKELNLLMQAYDRVAKGANELLLVSGESGVGKSNLIHELYPDIAQKNGLFIEGKYDQFQQQKPYSAITQAFNALFQYLVTLPAIELKRWQKTIQNAVGNNGRLLTDVMPDLELIIGQQPPVSRIDGQEAQNRFQRVVQTFIKDISRKENPLVLFLDDLQWADASSLQLLQTMLNQNDNQYFLAIGAYRSNEVHESHPFNITLHNLKQANEAVIHEVALQNLTLRHIEELLKDSLYFDDAQQLYQLAELIFIKTQGNAFFVNQFLKSLYEELLLTFSFKKQVWEWDISKIKEQNITDNVVTLMTQKINTLPVSTCQVLQIAACLGSTFSLQMISLVQQSSPVHVFKALWLAVTAGYIYPLDENYQQFQDESIEKNNNEKHTKFKFAHDRIEQATYNLQTLEERENTHWQIAQLLYAKHQNNPTHIFSLVNHFNKALRLVKQENQQDLVANLNKQAAEKAHKTNAYESALSYYTTVMQLLDVKVWDNYDFAFSLYTQYAECTYLTGDFDTVRQVYSQLLAQPLTQFDKIRVHYVLSRLLLTEGEVEKAQSEILKALDLLGVRYPKTTDESKVFLEKEYQEVNNHYQHLREDIIINRPLIQSEKDDLLLGIFETLGNINYILGETAFSIWAGLRLTNITLQKGNNKQSSYAFIVFGIYCIIYLKDSLKGYKIGRLALKISDKIDNQGQQATAHYVFGSSILHWVSHQRKNLKYQQKAIQYGLEGGNNMVTAYAMFSLLQELLLTGTHLEEVKNEHDKLLPVLKKINPYTYQLNVIPTIFQPLKQLLGETQSTQSFDDAGFNEKKFLAECNTNGVAQFYTAKARNLYIFGHFEQGASLAKHYDLFFQSVPTLINLVEGVYYVALHLLAVYSKQNTQQQQQDLVIINKALTQLEKWAINAPMNFNARYLLVLAEKAYQVDHQDFKAVDLYEQAIAEAHRTEFLYLEAIAHERIAQFWLAHKKDSYAKLHIQQAYQLYKAWGAKAKVRQLGEAFPYFLSRKKNKHSLSTHEKVVKENQYTTFRSSTNGGTLDLHTILKSSTALMKEVHLEALLEQMIKIVAESAGAQKVYIIENNQESLVVRMKGEMAVQIGRPDFGDIQVTALSTPLEHSTEVPISLINYVHRLRSDMVIANANEEKLLQKDAYIRKHRPKSLLCYPILRKERVSLIFYLENNLAIGAFTPERLEILGVLSSQINVSLENALLYENLEEKVKERTEQLRSKNREMSVQSEILKDMYQQLQKHNKNVTASINYALRIQESMLPKIKHIKKQLPELFLMYRPRDIVSGDFYWYGEKNGQVIIAAIDCTGHGVPGAFMSMLGHGILNQIVYTKKITDPGAILSSLHLGILTALRQRETDNRDGMDMTICVIDKQNKVLKFAGAKNPLHIIQDNELTEIKGNIMPIGGVWRRIEKREFNTVVFPLDKPTTVYIHSDGYQDQLGGPDEYPKKFMKRTFKQLLFSIHQKPMEEQQQILEEALDNWIGDLHSQTDDILLVGFRITPDMLA